MRIFREGNFDFYLNDTVEHLRSLKIEAIEAGDYERAARMKSEEDRYGLMAEQDTLIDDAKTRTQVDVLIAAARRSLQQASSA